MMLGLLGICFWREGLEAALGPERMGEKGGWLLGICFWREGLEAALGPERMGEKGGWFFQNGPSITAPYPVAGP